MQNGKTIKTRKNVDFNVDIFRIKKIGYSALPDMQNNVIIYYNVFLKKCNAEVGGKLEE